MPKLKISPSVEVELLSTRQAAEILQVSVRRIQQFCEEGRIGTMVGNGWVFTRDELDAFAKEPREVGNPNFKRAI